MSKKTKAQLEQQLASIVELVDELICCANDGTLRLSDDRTQECFRWLGEECELTNHFDGINTLQIELKDYDLPIGNDPYNIDSYTVKIRDNEGNLIKSCIVDVC